MVLGARVSFHRHLVGVDVGGWASSSLSSFLPSFFRSFPFGGGRGWVRKGGGVWFRPLGLHGGDVRDWIRKRKAVPVDPPFTKAWDMGRGVVVGMDPPPRDGGCEGTRTGPPSVGFPRPSRDGSIRDGMGGDRTGPIHPSDPPPFQTAGRKEGSPVWTQGRSDRGSGSGPREGGRGGRGEEGREPTRGIQGGRVQPQSKAHVGTERPWRWPAGRHLHAWEGRMRRKDRTKGDGTKAIGMETQRTRSCGRRARNPTPNGGKPSSPGPPPRSRRSKPWTGVQQDKSKPSNQKPHSP